jgi:protein-S-isoprenylcysteine O-methyltransferase Ste14
MDSQKAACRTRPRAPTVRIGADMSSPGTSIANWLKAAKQTKLYDLLAATPLIAWYVYCAVQQFSPLTAQVELAWLMAKTDVTVIDAVFVTRLVSSLVIMGFIITLIVLLIMRRKPKARSPGIYGRFVAVSGTFVGLGIVQLPPQELSPAIYLTSALLVLSGTLFATYAVLGLGRSLSVLPEARGLVTRGPYAKIRHPLYLGELIALSGITLQYFSGWALLLLLLQCAFQLERMRNEERVLSRVFPQYRDYMARTARLVPHIY